MTRFFYNGDKVYIRARGETLRGEIIDEGIQFDRRFIGAHIEDHDEFLLRECWFSPYNMELVPGTVLLAEALEEPSK